ncbi:YrrS family protein [Bacillus glycinifermentans]|uniref:YrrS family protein n=1 Tax=Bacillus glycinifermentans TaxID=1664069 RepID=UPI001FF3A06A|nr:YrrS family protein [Bacillus glycinifermentans]UOY90109.1 YrrS family protein [Bacillus glycinifermentans]
MNLSKTRESRFENRDKRRKANLVLNILIGIVLVLIVVVASSLMMNSPKEQTQQDVSKNDKTTEAPASDNKKQTSDEDVKDKEKADSDKKDKSDSDSDKDKDTASDEEKSTDDPFKGAKVTEGGSSANVEKTIVNPNWKPVGTKQSGEHTATYDSSSQDWAEMLEAISYATGVSEDNMTVVWLGNNGSPQDAKGTIRAKDSGDKYSVAITWVDGKGWKPTKVEKLK